jgi:hypothetical protein
MFRELHEETAMENKILKVGQKIETGNRFH